MSTLLPRRLGSTGLEVSRIGLGMAALGRPGYITLGHARDLPQDYDPAAMETAAHAVLDAAWEGGVRYFDTARSYGRGEAFLGSWLRDRRIPAADVVVSSKWGYIYTADWRIDADTHEVKEHTLPILRRQILETRRSLGEWLALFQIHSATIESGVLERREVLEELALLRDGGLLIGLSVSGPGQADTIRRATDIEIAGHRLFDVVQATWNLLEPSAGDALREAHDGGLGIIIKEALANGRLTDRNSDSTFAAKRAVLDAAARAWAIPIDAVALAAVLQKPWADVVLSGAATAAHLSSNLTAATVQLEPRTLEQLSELRETCEEYWTTRARLAWN
jgi:aryl-alcohol dehydrogenase-like predicted oxidoreductase